MLAQKIAVEASSHIAGIGIVAATLPVKQYKVNRYPALPMPIVMIEGTKDHAFPWDGGDTKILGVKVGPVISVDQLLAYWLQANGGQDSKLAIDDDLTSNDDVAVNAYMTKLRVPVTLFVIEGGGHTWPGARVPFTYIPFLGKQIKSLDAAEVIWETLRPYSRKPQPLPATHSKKVNGILNGLGVQPIPTGFTMDAP